MKPRESKAVVLTIGAIVVVSSILVLELIESGPFYSWRQKRMVNRVLAANPEQLRSAGRQLLVSRSGYVGEVNPSSSEIPSIIRRLKPTRISLSSNSVWVDFSDVFNPFGIAVFAAGADGSGPHKWIDGLWLFDDGQLEEFGQHYGVTNASTPNYTTTNGASSAAGTH